MEFTLIPCRMIRYSGPQPCASNVYSTVRGVSKMYVMLTIGALYKLHGKTFTVDFPNSLNGFLEK